MKKILFPALVIAALSITSCRKSRTCTCKTTTTNSGVSVTSTSVDVYGHVTKREARAKCMSDKYTITNTTTDVVDDCTLS